MSSSDISSSASKPSLPPGPKASMTTYDDVPVKTSGRDAPPPIDKWSDADLGKTLLNNIEHAGYTKPTPVQKHSIPIVMKNRDLMGCAQTGSGKTAAFLLPIIARMHANREYGHRDRGPALPICLILAPTRELVSQIYDEACKFAYKTGIRSAVIYGGTPLFKSIQTVHSGCDILVATPGRLADLMQKREVSVSGTKYLVLDEADRMLDMGFEPQIRQIVEKSGMPVTGQRRTLMFSATFPTEIQQLASSFLKDYVFLTVGRVGAATTLVAQKFINVDSYQKQNALVEQIRTVRGLTLIFVETKKKASQLERFLSSQGFAASSIHGDREQRDRERALRAFSTGQTPFLIATNVAARGLDIDNVTHVINFDMPANIDDYVHRIGRTGRAGKSGVSTSFISEKDLGVVPKLLDLLYDNNQEPPSWLVSLGQAAKYNRDMKMRGKKPRFGAKDFRQEFSANKYVRGDGYEGSDRDDKDYGKSSYDNRDEGPLAKRFKPESSGLPVNPSNVSTFIQSASNGSYKAPYPNSYGYGNNYPTSNGTSSSYGSYPSSSTQGSSYPPSSSSSYTSGSSYPQSSSSSSYSSHPSSSGSSYPTSSSAYPTSSSSYTGSSQGSSSYSSRWDKRKRDDYEPSNSSSGSYSSSSSSTAPSSSYSSSAPSSSYSNAPSSSYSSAPSSSYSSAPSSGYSSSYSSSAQQAPNTQSAYYYAQAYAAQKTPSQVKPSEGSTSSPVSGTSSQGAAPYNSDAYQQYQQYYMNYNNYYPSSSSSSYSSAKPPATSSTSSSSTPPSASQAPQQ